MEYPVKQSLFRINHQKLQDIISKKTIGILRVLFKSIDKIWNGKE